MCVMFTREDFFMDSEGLYPPRFSKETTLRVWTCAQHRYLRILICSGRQTGEVNA